MTSWTNRNTYSSVSSSSSSSSPPAIWLSAEGLGGALVRVFWFEGCISADPRTDDLLLELLERLKTKDRNELRKRFPGDVLSACRVSHLARSRASTWGLLRLRGVGGSVGESVVSVGSHRALCSDSSWFRWSLEKLAPQARRRYDNAFCLNSFTCWGTHSKSVESVEPAHTDLIHIFLFLVQLTRSEYHHLRYH